MKPSSLIISVLIISTLLLVTIIIDSKSRNSFVLQSQQNFVKLSTIDEPSFSTSEIEDRFLYLQKTINRIYPQMPKVNRLGFVYDNK